VGDLRGVARGDRQEGAEIEMALGTGEVAETAHIDDRNVLAPTLRDLRHRPALHLDGVRLELLVQAPPEGFGVDEDVARQDGAEMDGRQAPPGANRFRQRFQL